MIGHVIEPPTCYSNLPCKQLFQANIYFMINFLYITNLINSTTAAVIITLHYKKVSYKSIRYKSTQL